MRKWSGDGRFYLPARQIEPYRLWFEFLKTADRDPEIIIDDDYYADWGDFRNLTFNDWWTRETFKKCFAFDAAVRVLDDAETVVNDEFWITVRLPLPRNPKETIKDVQELLDQHGAGIKLANAPIGKFSLTKGYEAGFIKYLSNIRFMLRFYNNWLDFANLNEEDRLFQSVTHVVNWTEKRKSLLESRGTYDPKSLYLHATLNNYLKDVRAGRSYDGDGYNRKMVLRYLRRAQNLARNAADGNFPGKW
jgi:hypothetical protein